LKATRESLSAPELRPRRETDNSREEGKFVFLKRKKEKGEKEKERKREREREREKKQKRKGGNI